jgi:heavy metal translocating P-type ATPase
MAVECALVHGIRDRARIRVETPQIFNGSGSGFEAFINDQQGVRSVRVNASCHSVIVNFDPEELEAEDVVELIRHISIEELGTDAPRIRRDDSSKRQKSPVPRGAQRDLRPVPDPSEAPRNPDVQKLPRTELAGEQPDCELVHVTGARARVKVRASYVLGDFRSRFEAYIADQPGVQRVRVNASCQSVIVHFDPELVGAEDVLVFFQQISLERLESYPAREGEASRQRVPASWKPLALSGLAAGLGLAGVPLLPWGLVVGAAIPIAVRAVVTIVRKRKLNVDVLDTAAISVMAVQGQVTGVAVMLCLIWLGDLIRDLTMQRAKAALEEPFTGSFRSCWILRDGKKIRANVEDLLEGEQVVVYPGELIPVDGTVVEGRAAVDQKILTGESMPVDKGNGDEVFAATAVADGKLRILPEKIGEQTAAARIIQFVRDAPIRETRIQNYAEEMASRIAPWSLVGGGLSLALGDLNRASSLLAVEYGTGIRIAAPTTVMASTTKAARRGILVKGGAYLETLSEIGAVVFDKTGTLTVGTPEVIDVVSFASGIPSEKVLTLAAAADQRLTHPMAVAIQRAARTQGSEIPEREGFDYHIGFGVEAVIEGTPVLVGSHRFLSERRVLDGKSQIDLLGSGANGSSRIFVAVEGRPAGAVLVRDPLRPEAAEVVAALRERGVRRIAMLTGDHHDVAEKVAAEVGITDYVSESLPGQKAEYVRRLQSEGYAPVAVVGDGINDSPALVQADIGIAVRGGADVAQHAAHVALMQGNLWQIPEAIDISREAMSIIQQDWRLIAYPNTVAIALALLGLIGPAAASIIHNGGSTLAALNSLRPLLKGGRKVV